MALLYGCLGGCWLRLIKDFSEKTLNWQVSDELFENIVIGDDYKNRAKAQSGSSQQPLARFHWIGLIKTDTNLSIAS